MKIYSDNGNFQSLKLLISAELSGTSVQYGTVTVTQTVGESDASLHNSDQVVSYLSRNKLPVLEVKNGQFLFSPNTAAKYLFLKAGKVSDEDAENEILEWENETLLPVIAEYLVSEIGHKKKDKGLAAQLSTVLLQFADKRLGKSKFLTSDSAVNVGDVCVFSTLFPLIGLKNSDVLDKLPNVQRFCQELMSMSAVQTAVTKVTGGQGQDIFKASLLSQSFPKPCLAMSGSAAKTPLTSVTSSVSTEEQVPVERVSQEELDTALKAWRADLSSCPQPMARPHPILPQANRRNIMITSALPYVNNVPHLGNIIGCVLSADVFSRYARLRNYNTLYLCGTDEYGTATETKALEEGLTPQQICDKYNKLHTQIYHWFNIDFDYFGRTTTKQQTEISQDIFWKLYNDGFILKDDMEQLQCVNCNKFLADRFVEGTCPMCGFDDARGDQCDGCGKLINAVELVHPRCKICKSSPVLKTSKHLFIDLPKLEPMLKVHLKKVFATGTWTNNAKVITNSWIRDGLKPRCISRDLKWGVPIPLEGYRDKVFYVWFDAPIGYISITANYTDKWKEWWKNDEKVEYYNFLGKDNVPFHSVIFPSCLLGANDNYTIVNHMIATEYLNYEDTKFSKSRNTGIFGHHAQETGIPADVFRFYLLYLRPESQDTAFSWDDFLLKNNSELLNNLGNFINRGLMFLSINFAGVIQDMSQTVEEDVMLMALVTRELQTYITNLESCKLRDGIRNILTISRLGNQYMQANKPWVLIKGEPQEKQHAGLVVSLCANLACLLSVLLQPYMPSTSLTIQEQLQVPQSVNIVTGTFVAMLQPGHTIGKPSPLFQKIESSTTDALRAKFQGNPPEKASVKKVKVSARDASAPVDVALSPEEIERLTKAVAEQGHKVRELKVSKADKPIIDDAVAILLQRKKELSLAEGSPAIASPTSGKGKKNAGGKKGGGGGAVKTTTASQGIDGGAGELPGDVVRLTQAVADQGNKVKTLKSAKAEKSLIDLEVAALLQFKRNLAAAQGLDPAAVPGGGSGDKKKGKKK